MSEDEGNKEGCDTRLAEKSAAEDHSDTLIPLEMADFPATNPSKRLTYPPSRGTRSSAEGYVRVRTILDQ